MARLSARCILCQPRREGHKLLIKEGSGEWFVIAASQKRASQPPNTSDLVICQHHLLPPSKSRLYDNTDGHPATHSLSVCWPLLVAIPFACPDLYHVRVLNEESASLPRQPSGFIDLSSLADRVSHTEHRAHVSQPWQAGELRWPTCPMPLILPSEPLLS